MKKKSQNKFPFSAKSHHNSETNRNMNNSTSSGGDEFDEEAENSENSNLNKPSFALESKSQHRQVTINYICLCIFAFLLGVDFAVIIPTLWDRLSQDYRASGSFMGVVMSSYSLTGVVFGVFLGKLSDSVNTTKPIYVVCIILSILGHALYFVGINKYGILAARSLSGLALGASPVALAYIAKTTNEKQRITVLAFIMGSRQIGLMFGPAFNIFLRKANFALFNTFAVDRKSSPGLFMMLLWFICLVFVTIVYKDLNRVSTYLHIYVYFKRPFIKLYILEEEDSQKVEHGASGQHRLQEGVFSRRNHSHAGRHIFHLFQSDKLGNHSHTIYGAHVRLDRIGEFNTLLHSGLLHYYKLCFHTYYLEQTLGQSHFAYGFDCDISWSSDWHFLFVLCQATRKTCALLQ